MATKADGGKMRTWRKAKNKREAKIGSGRAEEEEKEEEEEEEQHSSGFLF